MWIIILIFNCAVWFHTGVRVYFWYPFQKCFKTVYLYTYHMYKVLTVNLLYENWLKFVYFRKMGGEGANKFYWYAKFYKCDLSSVGSKTLGTLIEYWLGWEPLIKN